MSNDQWVALKKFPEKKNAGHKADASVRKSTNLCCGFLFVLLESILF